MSFVDPIVASVFAAPGLAAAGAGLAAVPIIIHLLNRRRFRRVIWAAMDWLLAAQRKNARRIRIEQLLLLAIRCLIMLLIAFALAQPILGAMGLGRLFGQARTTRVIILDDSYSMNYGAGNETPLAKAKAAAVKLIDLFNPDDGVSVVLAGSPARTLIEQPVYYHKAVADAINQIQPTARGTDLAGAFKLALGILDRKDAPAGMQVIVIADRTRTAWQSPGSGGLQTAAGAVGESQPMQLGPAIEAVAKLAAVTMVDVGVGDVANLAITDLKARYEIRDEREVRLVATVHNFSTVERKGLTLRLMLDPQTAGSAGSAGPAGSAADVRQRMLEVPPIAPGKSVAVEDLVQFTEPGFHTVSARLVAAGANVLPDDLLGEDNERFFTMLIRPRVNAMLVDGQPGRRPVDSETFGLSLALAPITQTGRAGLDELQRYTLLPRIETALRAAPGWLSDVDLVVLANVDLLSTPENQRVADDLADFVRRGGGLMIFMGSQTDSPSAMELYNKLFYRDGAGPMPGKLVGPVGQASERREGEHLQIDDPSHPVLADFKAKAEPLKTARFFRHVKAELPPRGGATVLVRYSGGDPAIVLGKFGDGKVALVTTSANTAWNNFYNKPDFLPLFNQLAYYLAPAADLSRNLAVGGSLAEPLTARQAAGEAALHLPTAAAPAAAAGGLPSGQPANATTNGPAPAAGDRLRRITPEPRANQATAGTTASPADMLAERNRYLARADNLAQPGFYSLRAADAVFVYAVNPPADVEGDLRTLDRPAILSLLGRGAVILDPDQLDPEHQQSAGGIEVSRTLLYIVLGLCLMETFLAQRFGHFRE